MECLQIVQKDRARAGRPNLEGTTFYQGLKFLGFINFFEVLQEFYNIIIAKKYLRNNKTLLKTEFQNLLLNSFKNRLDLGSSWRLAGVGPWFAKAGPQWVYGTGFLKCTNIFIWVWDSSLYSVFHFNWIFWSTHKDTLHFQK